MRLFTKEKFSAILVSASVILSATLYQSCTKNYKDASPAPAANINDADGSFNGVPTNVAANISVGLVAYWPLCSTVYDFSGNGNKGIPHNVGAAADRVDNNTGAFYFNGNNSYIAVKDTPSLRLANSDFTVSAWVSAYNFNSTKAILTKRLPGAGNGWTLNLTPYSDNPSQGFVFGEGGLKSAAGNSLTWDNGSNSWHLVTVTYTLATQKMRIFINGQLQKIVNGIASPSAANTAYLYIGSGDPNLGGGADKFFGSMTDIRIYNRAISQAEAQYMFNVPPAPTAGLTNYITLSRSANDLASGNVAKGKLFSIKKATDRFGNPIGATHFSDTTFNYAISSGTPLSLTSGDFTLNSWVKIDAYGADYSPMLYWENESSPGGPAVNFGILGQSSGSNQGKVLYALNGTGTMAIGNKVVGKNKWHMITALYTVSTSTLQIYIDGVLDNTINDVPAPTISGTSLFIIGGGSLADGPILLNGALNDIRIYNRNITPTEITDLYRALN